MSKNGTADVIQKVIKPLLGEFLDGYVLTGIKAGTAKKIIVVNTGDPAVHYELLEMLGAAQAWGELEDEI